MTAIPSDADIIRLWEAGRNRSALARGLLLLSAARPALDERACAEVSMAERDRVLLRFRRAMFGPVLPARTECPRCGEDLEFDLEEDGAPESPVPAEVTLADRARFRLPTSADVAAGGSVSDLARRCCRDATDVPDEATLAALDARLAEQHAAAAIGLNLVCDACGHRWRDRLDIAAYLWGEIAHRAADLLDQVHWLASHYGWREAAILAISPERRAAYLKRCGA